MNSSMSLAKPVFIVGMNGSGTTMLLDNLSRHPELYAFPRETRLIPHLQSTAHRYGDLTDDANYRRLWDDVRGLLVFKQVNGQQPVPLPDDWQQQPRSLSGVLDGVFTIFARREGKQRWCEKTPQHAQHVQMLAELFPGAKFVHIIRDGRDSAASFARRWKRNPQLTIFRWKCVVREARRQGLAVGASRYLEVRYEDLTQEPEQWLRRICEFLELPFDEVVLRSSQPYLAGNKAGTKTGKVKGLSPNSGKWRKQFTPRTVRQLEKIAGSLLTQFGYQTSLPDADADPSTLQRKWWTLRDNVTQFTREVKLKLTGKIDRPWKVILARPLTAHRQRNANKY